jgi:phage baseplate assembly protein W
MPSDRKQLFGNDLQLKERFGGFDLVPGERLDLGLSQGNANVIQALQLRLRIRRGELAPLGWPRYGSRIHELIGEPNTSRTHARLMAYARTALEADARVQEIQSLRAEVLPGERTVVRLFIDILLIDEPNPLLLISDINLEGV